MKGEIFRNLYRKLNRVEDIKKLSKEFNMSEESIFVIYSQKVTRNATKNFYQVKVKCKNLLRTWLNGKSFLTISKELNFPPVLTALLILLEYGISRKKYWQYLCEVEQIGVERIREELKEVAKCDLVYSPNAMVLQRKRGDDFENFMKDWLCKNNIEFLRENDLKPRHKKTPDFLLKNPFKIDNFTVNWIECKASFGDDREFRRNSKKQLLPYLEQFGTGVVVYKYGIIDELEIFDGVRVLTEEFFKNSKLV